MKTTISSLIKQEKQRQKQTIGLIPSENISSSAVREAVGSVLMHKYAEGQPRKRYYQGNQIADQVEQIAKDEALAAFNLSAEEWGANVQAHSGCEANLAVYNAVLEPGDKILAMYLPDGGHLSHGWQLPGKKVTLVSKIFKIDFYHVAKETRLFDYEQIAKQAEKFKPKLIISGGTAYARAIDHHKMGKIAKKVGAYYLADISHEAGLVAAGAHPAPFADADVVTFTTHKTLRGPRGAVILSRQKDRLNENQNLAKKIDTSVFPGLQGGPHLHSIAGIAVALQETQTAKFKKYAAQVVKNAQLFAQIFADNGFDVVGGGTDKHLVLLDLRKNEVSAWVAAWALEYANIILNRNSVPYDDALAYYPSGLRFGTPIITTRGMKEAEVKQLAAWMIEVINYCKKWALPADKVERQTFVKNFKQKLAKDKFLQTMKTKVTKFAKKYPLFAGEK